ncbi:MAG: hypothetical protein GYB33_17170 [Gammaproteobacteria bacterium]|nr:hypothetical protein [Gammaproteobacteria bacterium]
MRLRRLALAVGLASAFSTSVTNALGLGEIKLLSNLNQPLEAEIKLLQVRDLSENEILVSLASKDEFQRAGIDRLFLLTDLKFSVRLDAPTGPVIRVTTRNPVREPYLNFLLESQWPNGRILREYTVLLDLPVFADQRPQPVQSATTTSPRSAQGSSRPAPAPSRAVSSSASSSSAASGAGDVYGPVSATDTLWDIALKVRPSRQYSVHKTMLALQRLNPEAFINGNINMLRRGQVLRIPRAADIDQYSQQQALNEVAFQNNQWAGEQPEQPAAAQLDATGRSKPAPAPTAAIEGRVKVATDTPSGNLPQGSGSGQAGGSGALLQKDLAVSLEELDRAKRENSDLQSRVRALEEQIKTMERLVEVSSRELRALQLQSEQGNQQAAAPLAGTAATAPDTKPAAAPARVDAASATAAGASGQGRSWFDFITDNILYLGGALVAVLAAVLMLLRRREEEEEPELAMAAAAPVAGVAVAGGEEDLLEVDLPDDDDEELLADELGLAEAEPQKAVAAEPQTDDVVGEADIYIAYGKLDQAKAMLMKALEVDPDNTVARLKLMEVFAEANDLPAFDEQYAQISVTGDESSIARADDLRMHFEDVPPLAEAGAAGLGAVDLGAEDLAEPDVDLDEVNLEEVDLDEVDVNEVDLDIADWSSATDTPKEGAAAAASAATGQVGFDVADDDFGKADDDFGADLQEESFPDLALDDDFLNDTSLDDSLLDDSDLGDNVLGDNVLDDITPENSSLEDFSLEDKVLDENALEQEVADFDFDLELDEEDALAALDDGELDSLALDDAAQKGATEDDLDFDFTLDDLDTGEEGSAAVSTNELAASNDKFDLDTEEIGLDFVVDGEVQDGEGLDSEDLDFSLGEQEAVAEAGEGATDLEGFAGASDEKPEFDAGDDEAGFELDFESLEGGGDLASSDLNDELQSVQEPAEPEIEADSDFDLQAEVDDIDLAALDEELGALSGLAEADESAPATELTTDDPFAELAGDELVGETPDRDALDREAIDREAQDEAELTDDAFAALDEELELEGFSDLEDDVAPEGDVAPEDVAAEFGAELAAAEEASAATPAAPEPSDDELFSAALADLPSPEDVLSGEEDAAEEDDFDFLADTDETATKLDLARAYIDMGDHEGAKDILDEVAEEGDEQQRQQAQELMSRLG